MRNQHICTEKHKRKLILVASLTDHSIDGRIARQIRSLSKEYRVISAGTGKPPISHVDSLSLEKPGFAKSLPHRFSSGMALITRNYEGYYWSRPWVKSALRRLNAFEADLYLVNDLPLLPAAIRIAGDRPVIFDAHEYYPRQNECDLFSRILLRPYMNSLCAKYLHQASSVVTVSPGLAAEYKREFGVKPELVRNAPFRENLSPSSTSCEVIRTVYHGTAQLRRKTETIINAVIKAGERFELHLYLMAKAARLDELRRCAAGCKRIVFHPPVPNHLLCKTINQHDVGVTYFEPTTFNLKHCLPNKLFEYIQARLAVITGPSPDIETIVKKHDCGIVTEQFSVDSLASALQLLSRDKIDHFKRQSEIASQVLTWEIESEVLKKMIETHVGFGSSHRHGADQ